MTSIYLLGSLTDDSSQGKLEMITGAESGHQDLRLYDERNTEVARMDNNDAMLGAYPVENGYRIHVREPLRLVWRMW